MPPEVAGAAGNVQLKYKGVDEYTVDVSIQKVTVADEPVPEYNAFTFKLMVPCVVLVPFTFTREQLENAHEALGMLKYQVI